MNFKSLLLGAAMGAIAPAAHAQVYACGVFNGWNALEPTEFAAASDGIYTAEINFSDGAEFKLSTVKGATGNGWNEFDTGTLYYSGTPAAGLWTPLEAKPASSNLTAPGQGVYNVTVNLNDMLIRFEGVGADDTHPWSGTLPLLVINTEDGAPITSKEDYITATWYLDPMGADDVEALGSPEAPLTTQIRGRGNYTWLGFDKKPYRLKLTEKQPLMGMTKSKHWALLAHADDNVGFMRNFTGFTASERLGMPWTPGSKPLEVVLNGDYIGLYFLTQTIRVDKDRVNITEQDDLATTDVDGGWLLEIDNYDTDPHLTVFENDDTELPIWFTYQSPEELSTEQLDYVTAQMNAIDAAIYSSDKNDAAALEQLVDFDILARYYIAQELLDDTESFHGSCYLYRNRGAAEKWCFGPVWDFGSAFQRGDSRQFIWQDPNFHQVWIGEIYKFPAFVNTVKKVWAEFLGADGPAAMKGDMNSFAASIAKAAACDAKRWPQYGNADEVRRAADFTDMFMRRVSWLKEQWGTDDVVDIAAANDVHVAVSGRDIVVTGVSGSTVEVSDIAGRVIVVPVVDGVAVATVSSPGFYIVANQKVIVR